EAGERSGDILLDDAALVGYAPTSEAGLDPDALENLAAPLFNVRSGRRADRAIRALLNLPLRLFGRPPTSFNREVRRILASWTQLLRESLDVQAKIQRQIAVHAGRLDRLTERNAELEQVIVALRRLLSSDGAPERRAHDAAPPSAGLPVGASL